MRASASLMAGTTLAASFGLHLAGFNMVPEQQVQIVGGATMQVAMLGNSFTNVSAGTISPVTTEKAAELVDDAVPLEPPAPESIQPVPPPDQVQATAPPAAALVVIENRNNPVVALSATPTTASSVVAVHASAVTTTEPPKTEAPLAPVMTLKALTAEAPVEVQQAKPNTRRPVTRPPKPAVKRPKPTTPRRTQTVTARPKPQGGQAASRGQATGSTTGQAASSSQQGIRSTAAGNAAASNYPGQVMRVISRTRKQRAGARGKATVGFKISSSGAATSIRILRSSGSAKIDHIAIRHIQRASPFPRPPKGARRSFSVVFVSKG